MRPKSNMTNVPIKEGERVGCRDMGTERTLCEDEGRDLADASVSQ